ncbi:PLP-dependent aminotransferase family protein [Lactiplantibacillus fabifermentans]|uniref:Aminotransferase n=2 Tax=Lactiplantibacillus fabifermentans TaxID=483011 RepID=A0A0R2NYI0_9LACO|nr:PLP-dependent aminotransferase family protein [Lactiplantibacillus fabifermentans]ETY74428.1 aminotransferase [Lactiplantibacillus fabifermentans T30PCM01]KRO28685.1 aminotransferase [Lactiplantibacillus fabifermentans DSM 21115]
MTTLHIDWQPDKTSSVPIYQQITNYFQHAIASGDWPMGAKLPSQRKLAPQFGVNRSTLITALDELIAVGLITSNPGSGMAVSGNHWSSLLAEHVNWSQYVKAGQFKPNSHAIQKINQFETDDVIRLSTGEPAPEQFPRVLFQKAFDHLGQHLTSLNYTEPAGILALREQIARHLQKVGIQTQPENILITSGSLQALQLVSLSLFPKDATIYTEAPTYVKSLQVFQSANTHLAGVPMDNQGMAYWQMTPPTNGSQAIMYTIPTFNNPTGIVMSQARRQQILQYAQEHQMPILEDAAYQDVWFDQQPPQPLKALDETGNVIYFGSISKSLAPGLRIGWTVATKPVIDRLTDVRMQTDYGASSLSQLVLAEILANPEYDTYQANFRAVLAQKATAAQAILHHYWDDGIATFDAPTGGFYLWVRLADRINIKKLFDLATAQNVLFNPGNIYDFKPNQYIRLSFSFESTERFERGIQILTKLIEENFPK